LKGVQENVFREKGPAITPKMTLDHGEQKA
jgi:hypothetical protein